MNLYKNKDKANQFSCVTSVFRLQVYLKHFILSLLTVQNTHSF